MAEIPTLTMMAAGNFVASKGRLPKDRYELGEWLMEFTDELGKILDRCQKEYSDYVTASVHPLFVIETQQPK